jgi:hypothetical protein
MHLTVLIVVWHLVSIILRIIYLYILVPKGTSYSYISKNLSSLHDVAIFLKFLESSCGSCSNHILVICILSYFVIIALFHHQEIKDHLFGPSNSSAQIYLGVIWYSWKKDEVVRGFYLCILGINEALKAEPFFSSIRSRRSDSQGRSV